MVLTEILAGIVATAGMTTFLWFIDKTGKINANMVRALCSALTRSVETSLIPGLLVQFLSGIIFAFIYTYVLNLLQLDNVFYYMLAGSIIGFGHGFAFSFIMVILAEHHPVERFQNAGFQVAIIHFLAHVIYGFLIGLMVSYFI